MLFPILRVRYNSAGERIKDRLLLIILLQTWPSWTWWLLCEDKILTAQSLVINLYKKGWNQVFIISLSIFLHKNLFFCEKTRFMPKQKSQNRKWKAKGRERKGSRLLSFAWYFVLHNKLRLRSGERDIAKGRIIHSKCRATFLALLKFRIPQSEMASEKFEQRRFFKISSLRFLTIKNCHS